MKRSMDVLLRENVRQLGICGDVVRVSTGFARNYLFPRRLAVHATAENKRSLARRAARMAVEAETHRARVAATLAALAEIELETVQRADEQGHLYGSVSAALVVELLARAGFSVEERNVRLATPIKTVGTHAVPIHVHGEENAEVRVTVVAE